MSHDSENLGATMAGTNVIKMNVAGWDSTLSELTSYFKNKDIVYIGKLKLLNISSSCYAPGILF